MLGGGNFIFTNKVLPGAYINFESKSKASVDMAERGYIACPLTLNWGKENEIITIESSDLQKRSVELLGYSFDSVELKPIRELLLNAKTLYIYRLSKNAVKSNNKWAIAKFGGTRGNDISIKVTQNVDNNSYDVYTILEDTVVDIQTVSAINELKPNSWVDFKSTGDSLQVTTSLALTGGTNGATVTGTEYQSFLDAIESYYINSLTTTSTDPTIKKLFVAFTKRMRNEVGSKFQTVLYREEADFEGVVNVQSKVLNDSESLAVLWVAGTLAGCEINKSLTNKTYTGEYEIETKENQTALVNAKKSGKFIFHNVNGKVKVLSDINSLTTITKEKNSDFTKNQIIRITDQVAVDIAHLFNSKYLGVMPNDDAGRLELWKDIVLHHENLMNVRALENFKATDIKITRGNEKDQVIISDVIQPVTAMEQLYMNVIIG